MFYASGAARRLARHLRRWSAWDAAHCKSVYLGNLYLVVTKSANSKLVPLAIAWTPSAESEANWSWVAQHASVAFPHLVEAGAVEISDGDKGLAKSLAALFPDGVQRRCTRHLMANVGRGKELQQAVWQLARATSEARRVEVRAKVERASTEVCERLDAYMARATTPPLEQWALSAVPDGCLCLYGETTSNLAESGAAWAMDERRRDPTTMMIDLAEKTRVLLTNLYVESSQRDERLPPRVEATLAKNREVGSRLQVMNVQHALRRAAVRGRGVRGTHTVDLSQPLSGVCDCGETVTTGILCCHGCAAATALGHRPAEVLDKYLTRDTERAGFEAMGLPPMVSTADLGRVPLKPSTAKPRRGRPKHRRIRSTHQAVLQQQHHCSHCGEAGHNRSTCGRG